MSYTVLGQSSGDARRLSEASLSFEVPLFYSGFAIFQSFLTGEGIVGVVQSAQDAPGMS
jgi:hypothetical protein